MFGKYNNLVLLLVGLFLFNHFTRNTVENMAPIGHINVPHWQCGDQFPSPQHIIDIRNNELVAQGFDHNVPKQVGPLDLSPHLNPPQLNPNEQPHFVQYKEPDQTFGCAYN